MAKAFELLKTASTQKPSTGGTSSAFQILTTASGEPAVQPKKVSITPTQKKVTDTGIVSKTTSTVKKISDTLSATFVQPSIKSPVVETPKKVQPTIEKSKVVKIKPDAKKVDTKQLLDLGQVATSFATSAVEGTKATFKNLGAIFLNQFEKDAREYDAYYKEQVKKYPNIYKKGFIEKREQSLKEVAKKAESLEQSANKDLEQARRLKIKSGINVNDKRKFEEKIKDPQWIANSVAESIPSLLTSLGITVATGAVTKNPIAALSAGFAGSFAQEASGAYKDARDFGVDKRSANNVAIQVGIGAGLLDVLPIAKLLDRSPGGSAIKKQIIKEMTKKIAVQAGLESGTESLQEIVANVVAKTYDKNRSFFAGVPESALIGGLLGGTAEVGGLGADLGKRGEMTPQEVIGNVISSGQEETKEGKELIKIALEAQQLGNNVVFNENKRAVNEPLNIPLIDKAKDYVSVEDFANEVYNTTPNSQIGIVNPNDIVPRDPVDTNSPRFLALKEDIRLNGIQEPVYVTMEGGAMLTTDGSQRTVAAQELGKGVPVIVTNGNVEGLKTIKEVYDEVNTGAPKRAQEKIQNIQEGIQQAQVENEAKRDVLSRFTSDQVQAMRAIGRSISIRENKGLDPISVSELPVYKKHIEDIMSVLDTNSEDEAIRFIQKELPEKPVSVTNRREQQELKSLKTRIEPKEVTVPRSQLPVGEGKERISKLEARVRDAMQNVTKEQIDELGLTTYRQMNKKEAIEDATRYIIEHPDEAMKVLRGEMDPPKGILPESIYVAMVNAAQGDITLATKLATLQATALGQRISILSEISKDSPVKVFNEIIRVREEAFKKKFKDRSPQEVRGELVKKMQEKIKKPSKSDWNAFINSIDTC